jgi:hypothetical protein
MVNAYMKSNLQFGARNSCTPSLFLYFVASMHMHCPTSKQCESSRIFHQSRMSRGWHDWTITSSWYNGTRSYKHSVSVRSDPCLLMSCTVISSARNQARVRLFTTWNRWIRRTSLQARPRRSKRLRRLILLDGHDCTHAGNPVARPAWIKKCQPGGTRVSDPESNSTEVETSPLLPGISKAVCRESFPSHPR